MTTLRPYQQEAIDGIYQWFAENDGNPLVVMPTGTGKSVVIAELLRDAFAHYHDTRVIMLTHVRELIAQNHAALLRLWPDAPAGIYSAGLGRRDLHSRIVMAGIQSIYTKAHQLQNIDLVLVDEAHLIPRSSDTMYGRFLNDLRRSNPKLKIVGFTATHFRLDSGFLHDGADAMFNGIAYEYTVARALDEGFLCEPVPYATGVKLNVDGVGKRGGEFIAGQLEAAVDKDDVNRAAVEEIILAGAGRGSWLVFCAGVKHAEHVRDVIRSHGISCETITGDTSTKERDRNIAAFKRGEIKCVTNANVLTTGFDAPGVDLIALLRPTASTGLHVQMIGRGTRLAEGKEDCIVLDFAGNTQRHGPLDALNIKKPGEGGGEAPVKECPDCHALLYTAVRECPHCGHQFPPPEPKIDKTPYTDALLVKQRDQIMLDVLMVIYERHEKPGKTPSMRVTYSLAPKGKRVSEWVCFEHQGFARSKAVEWWVKRAPGEPVPSTVEEALDRVSDLPRPARIATKPEGQYEKIVKVEF